MGLGRIVNIMYSVNKYIHIFFRSALTHGGQGIKGLNLVNCGNGIMLGLYIDVNTPERRQSTFISITRKKRVHHWVYNAKASN